MVVIYAEKHSLAKTIAAVLGAGSRIPCKAEPTVAHWEFFFKGEAAIICHGSGHLAELVPAKAYGTAYEKWDLDNFPCVLDEFMKKPIERSRNCFDHVKSLFGRADWIINATDPDREGELIFGYVMETMNCNKPFKRVWLDDLTDSTIINAFNNLKDSSEIIPLQCAGRARDIADWLIGCNLTIAMTKKFGSPQNMLSVGRVTEPPKRYTETDLIATMELAGQKLDDEEARTLMKLQKKGLGTDATRAAIVGGLFEKGFLQKGQKKGKC